MQISRKDSGAKNPVRIYRAVDCTKEIVRAPQSFFGRDFWHPNPQVNCTGFHRKKAGKYVEAVVKAAGSAIIKSGIAKEVANVHQVGKIDKEIYKCITENIVTDEVIITDERIGHIKERHPNDYERYYKYLKNIVEHPDYIVETNKPNTALILKSIEESDEKQFKTVVRLITSSDDLQFKNSIITFMKINEKEWRRLLRNKKILYKRE